MPGFSNGSSGLSFLVLHAHLNGFLSLLIGVETAGPLVCLAHRRFEVTARIHFEWQILVSDRHILGGLRQYTVELLPAEVLVGLAVGVGQGGQC